MILIYSKTRIIKPNQTMFIKNKVNVNTQMTDLKKKKRKLRKMFVHSLGFEMWPYKNKQFLNSGRSSLWAAVLINSPVNQPH